MSAGIVVFGLVWMLVSARRLGALPLHRPIVVVAGAGLMIALGVLSPEQAWESIDGPTLALLLGMMGMAAFLTLDGATERAAAALAGRSTDRRELRGRVVWGAAGLSALLTNDAAVVLLAPVVVQLVRAHRLPPLPYLLALATAANTGSAATLVGNPQNMLCAALGELSYRDHLLAVGPAALVGVAINHALLLLLCRKDLGGAPLLTVEAAPLDRRTWLALGVVGATAVAHTAGASLPGAALLGFGGLLALRWREAGQALRGVDWAILGFFAGLFVVVQGLVASGLPARWFAAHPLWVGEGAAAIARLSAVFLLGSNLVSNVPFILVVQEQMASLPDPELGWELLTVTSTFAGNLTLLGSVANVIVASRADEVGGLGFLAHLRVGLPVAVVTTAVAVPIVVALG